MAENLTQEDIDYLSGLVGNSHDEGVDNRDAYYSYLEDRGYQYGGLAGGVVREDSISGRIAVAFLADTAAQSGNEINFSTYSQISYDLMVADFQARASLVEQQGFAGELGALVHYDNHKAVFSDPEYGLGIENWTAAEPIEYAIENYEALGFSNPAAAADATLTRMMEADTFAEMIGLQQELTVYAISSLATLMSAQELQAWLQASNTVFANNAGYIFNMSGTRYQTNQCFKSDTPIQMWPLDPSITPRANGTYDEQGVLSKVWEKPICQIQAGDLVVAYDDKGRLQPSTVTRTMQNQATHLLDFWDTGVTPGHAYYCADGKFKDQHVPLMDILRADCAIMRADGSMIRATTNCKVGSMGDMMVHASASLQKPDGTWTKPKPGKVRFGMRIIMPDGRHTSFMEIAAGEGWRVSDDGYMVGMMKGEDGELKEQKFLFPYVHGEELPEPEAYILARSAVTLEEIYAAGEWEQIGTQMPAPAGMVGLNTNHTSTLLQPSKLEPNIPPAFADHPDAPKVKQHNAVT